jgi:hypothetical protein
MPGSRNCVLLGFVFTATGVMKSLLQRLLQNMEDTATVLLTFLIDEPLP